MKYKYLLLLVVCFCTTGAYADKLYSPSDFMDFKKDGHIKHIINPDQLLSPKEEYNLNAKLDSIYKETDIDISIVLFSNIRSYSSGTSDKFAAELHSYWKRGLFSDNPDSSLVIAYNQQKTDFGYYLGESLINSSLGSILVEMKEDIFQEKKTNKKVSYTVITQKLLPEIEQSIKKIKEKKQELETKKTVEQDVQKAKMMPVDIAASIIVSIVTLVGLYFWTNRKRRMALRYDYVEDARAYLNNKIILISLFFLFLFPVIIATISLLLGFKPGYTEYFIVVVGLFMFFGWIPTVIFIQMQKRRLPGMIPSRETLVIQQNLANDDDRRQTSNEDLTSLNNVLWTLQQRTQQQQTIANQKSSQQQNDSLKININTAASSQIRELSILLTIVEVNRIVKERDTNGDYKSLRDLQRRTDLSTILLDEINSKVVFEPSSESSDKAQGRTVDF